MSDSSIFSVTTDDIAAATRNNFTSSIDNGLNFVRFFPPELSEKLFSYLPVDALMKCAQTCLSWRLIANCNLNWQRLCKIYGYISNSGESDPNKWNKTLTHVDASTTFRFRSCPKFALPPVASTRLEPLCEWGLYFRQCRKLQKNWSSGQYVIHKLQASSEHGICTSADFNGNIIAFGSSIGSVYIWSVRGVPKLMHVIQPIRLRVEVEDVKLTSKYLVILYQIGIIRIYKLESEKSSQVAATSSSNCNNEETFVVMICQFSVAGAETVNPREPPWTLNVRDISDEFLEINGPIDGEDDLEDWIRELFREVPWFEAEYSVSDMEILTTENYLMLTGAGCNCFLIWELETGKLVQKVQLNRGFLSVSNFQLTQDKIYLPSKQVVDNQVHDPNFFILVYSLSGTAIETEIPTQFMVEEIQVESNNQRMVWITQDSTITIRKVENGEETRIERISTSYVDSLILHGDYIIFHEYDGLIGAINWNGEHLYQTTGLVGIVRGLQCYKDFLVSGGDVRQLCVWNVHTGKKLYEIYHQPCRIAYVFVDETKIITLGIEDAPVLIGFW